MADRPGLRARMDDWLERRLPGLNVRLLWITVAGAWLMVVYAYQGSLARAPAWFLAASESAWGIPIKRFHQHGWGHVSAVMLLMLVPLLLGWLLERWTPRDLGLSIRGAGRELLLVAVLWIALIPILWLTAKGASFQRMYPRLPEAETDAALFAIYQAFYLVKWTAWEFFFRGFLLFGLHRDMGNRAILASTLPFVVMHVGKPEPEALSSLVGGLVLCVIALKGRSIWPGVFIHSMVATTLDFFASTWWR